MTKAEAAAALVADMLKAGPRGAMDILAAAQDAKIGEGTLRRAAKALGVVVSRAEFRGGWVWRLPENGKVLPRVAEEADLAATTAERAEIIAARLRKLEAGRGKAAPIHAGDPRLIRWVEAGISDPDLREAYELARFNLPGDGPVTVGHLDKFVAAILAEGAEV